MTSILQDAPTRTYIKHVRSWDAHAILFKSGDLDLDAAVAAKGGLTLAFRVLEDGALIVSIARCRKEEHYCKRMGREIAMRRLIASDYEILMRQDGETHPYDTLRRWLSERTEYRKNFPHALRVEYKQNEDAPFEHIY